MSSIKSSWTNLLRNLHDDVSRPFNFCLNILLRSYQLTSKSVYRLMEPLKHPHKSYLRWCKEVLILKEEWSLYCVIPFKRSPDVKHRWFQYRLLHRIIPTNSYLYKVKILDSNLCNFFFLYEHTIYHLFFDCCYFQSIWRFLQNILTGLM